MVLAFLPSAAFVALACAPDPETRYRVLSYFFDGVPDPNAPAPAVEPTITGDALTAVDSAGPAGPEVPIKRMFYAHTPYRKNQCGGCHNRRTGRMFRPLGEGLCVGCHRDLVKDLPYLHGPAVVNACAFCHHYHGSSHPKMLLDEASRLCFRCHERDDLTVGEHHTTVDQETCVACHDAHGGTDRFFLKRSEH